MLSVIAPLSSTEPVWPPRTWTPTALSTSVAEIEAPESTVTLLFEFSVTPGCVEVGFTVQPDGSSTSAPPVGAGPEGQAANAAPARDASKGATAAAVTRALRMYETL